MAYFFDMELLLSRSSTCIYLLIHLVLSFVSLLLHPCLYPSLHSFIHFSPLFLVNMADEAFCPSNQLSITFNC